MDQTGVLVHAGMVFHPEIKLVAFLGLGNLGITLPCLVLEELGVAIKVAP